MDPCPPLLWAELLTITAVGHGLYESVLSEITRIKKQKQKNL